ncbi:MAG: hypothetical protein R3F11_18795 [Verrucomicrobiales bacterium]
MRWSSTGDPHESAAQGQADGTVKQVLFKPKRAVEPSGKALLRERALERSFCHVLDHGKQRRKRARAGG